MNVKMVAFKKMKTDALGRCNKSKLMKIKYYQIKCWGVKCKRFKEKESTSLREVFTQCAFQVIL